MDPMVLSIVRDDDRPVKENMSLRNDVLAGFVVTFNQPVIGWTSHLRIQCGMCGGTALEDKKCYLSCWSSGSNGPTACKSCGRYMLTVGHSGVDGQDTVQVFSVELSGGVAGTVVNRSEFKLELSNIEMLRR